MIQFNLLPKIKLDYVKAKRNKRMTIVVSVLASAAALGILVLLFMIVQVFQKQHSNNLTQDIKSETSKLRGISDLDKILTIQNQLNSLTALHDKKPVASRLTTYVKQFTPANVTIASITVDLELYTITMSGSADTIATVNKFVDTLKFTNYQTADKTAPAFSSVVLAGFGKGEDKVTTYQINFSYDPIIFSNGAEVKLVIPPGKITTRSQTEKPESIFQPLQKEEAN